MSAARFRSIRQFFFTLLLGLACVASAGAEEFKIGVMQAQAGSVKKYAALESYLKAKSIDVKFVHFSDYNKAASMFDAGELDGMFSGSGVAGIFILKGVATPLVRPVDEHGRSTYWAVIIGKKGEKPFNDQAAYFNNRTVAYSAIASSGEFYYRSIPGIDRIQDKTVIAANHQEALEMVRDGKAEFAIVKNLVWNSLKGSFPEMELVGQDAEQNPDNTLIISKKTPPATVKKILAALMAIERAPDAAPVREGMKIKGFVMTTGNDFSHTLELLKGAGVTEKYAFK